MGQLVLTLVFILISSVLLATEQKSEIIKCDMISTEHKVYKFDLNANKYSLGLVEKGRQKSSLSRQIQQLKPVQNYASYKEYHFAMDDRTKAIIKMDPQSKSGKGELIQAGYPVKVKAFSKCEQL